MYKDYLCEVFAVKKKKKGACLDCVEGVYNFFVRPMDECNCVKCSCSIVMDLKPM